MLEGSVVSADVAPTPAAVAEIQTQAITKAEAVPVAPVEAKNNANEISLRPDMAEKAGLTILTQQAEATFQRYKALKTVEERSRFLKDPNNARLVNLRNLQSLQSENLKGFDNGESPIIGTNSIVVIDYAGHQWKVISVTDAIEDSFNLKVVDAANPGQEQVFSERNAGKFISRNDLIRVHIVQNIAPNISLFSEAQRPLVQAYVDALSENPPTSEIKFDRAKLKDALEEPGILTLDDLRIFLERRFPQTPIPKDQQDTKVLEAANEGNAKRVDELLKPFENNGYIVDNPRLIVNLFSELGVNAVSLSETQNQAAQEVIRLKLLLDANKNKVGKTNIIITVDGKPKSVLLTEEIYRQWEVQRIQAETESLVCLDTIKAFKEGFLKDYFDQLNAGTLSPEDGQLVVESFRNGEIAKPPDIKTAKDEQSRARLEKLQKIWERQEILKKGKKGLLTGGFSILGLLGAFGLLVSKKEHP
jgi:hypothetical protein